MLIRLEIENFYSIKERQVVDLRVARNAPDLPERFLRIPSRETERVVRTAIFFGPNASGKSTVLRALNFVARFVRDSFNNKPDEEIYGIAPFEHSDCRDKETSIIIQFAGAFVPDQPSCVFTYELRIKHNDADSTNYVSYEALRFAPQGRTRKLFERKADTISILSDFKLGKLERDNLRVRPNVSLISTLSQFEHLPSCALVDYFRYFLSNMNYSRWDEESEDVDNAIRFYDKHRFLLKELNDVIGKIDLGIESVDVMVPDKGPPLASFKHIGLDRKVIDTRESRGTRRFFVLFLPLSLALNTSGKAIIDEIDTDIHSLLLPEVVGWFQSNTRMSDGGQLIATCHNPSLLSYLEKEEIFFTEKSLSGETTVYSLQDIKDIRRADNYLKRYMGGELGAIPRIG